MYHWHLNTFFRLKTYERLGASHHQSWLLRNRLIDCYPFPFSPPNGEIEKRGRSHLISTTYHDVNRAPPTPPSEIDSQIESPSPRRSGTHIHHHTFFSNLALVERNQRKRNQQRVKRKGGRKEEGNRALNGRRNGDRVLTAVDTPPEWRLVGCMPRNKLSRGSCSHAQGNRITRGGRGRPLFGSLSRPAIGESQTRRHFHAPPMRSPPGADSKSPPRRHTTSRGSGHSRGIPLISKIIIIYTRKFCPSPHLSLRPSPPSFIFLSHSIHCVSACDAVQRGRLLPLPPLTGICVSWFFSSFLLNFNLQSVRVIFYLATAISI